MEHDNDQVAIGSTIPYSLYLDCVHCGLCTSACPTYVETGNENDSPRGRIHLMRSVSDGRIELTGNVRRHLELCLDCRACETACPSGVQYGRLIEPFRTAMEESGGTNAKTSDWFHRWILFKILPNRRLMNVALKPARWSQKLGLARLASRLKLDRLLSPRLQQLVTMLPTLRRQPPRLPTVLPAEGRRRARVALFRGCVADVMFRDTHWATARVLQRNGCDVVIPESQTCCGALHLHSGDSHTAQHLSNQNIDAFPLDDFDAIVVNVAGCGSMLKEYAHHWNDDRQEERGKLADKVKDVCEFLDELGIERPRGSIPLRATYHDACHLTHAQKIRDAPRRLLSQIPDLELVELPESELCCGAAGTYNLTEPEMAMRLGTRKMNNILSTGAELIVTANAGCLLQISREVRRAERRMQVKHPIELLDQSYRSDGLSTTK